MKTLRTPEDRFDGLPGFDFGPHYASVEDLDGGQLRVRFLDEGPRDADPVLLFHGDPSWCYLYRAAGQAHSTIADGGHFLQEDKGEDIAAVIVDFIAANPIPTTTGAHP